MLFFSIVACTVMLGSAVLNKNGDLDGYDMAPIMFWRPQKVGSSTVLPMLESFAFRMEHSLRPIHAQNDLCRRAAKCAYVSAEQAVTRTSATRIKMLKDYAVGKCSGCGSTRKSSKRKSKELKFSISLTHEMCSFGQSASLHDDLMCSFETDRPVKQFIILRDPLSRALSVYYFWGELFRLRGTGKKNGRMTKDIQGLKGLIKQDTSRSSKRLQQLGSITQNKSMVIRTPLFWYHGNETSAPSLELAVRYANNLPFKIGMPGPSYSWSAFGETPSNAVEYLTRGNVSPMILERLDESLVVLAHYLEWSLADVVVIKPRKALSQHPRASQWPREAISTMSNSLRRDGEYKFYEASNELLSSKIAELKAARTDVDHEVSLLRRLRSRATEVCFQKEELERYKNYLSKFLPPDTKNHLRDVEAEYVTAGHLFKLNDHIFYSFDLCGSCEAHAILSYLRLNPDANVEDTPKLSDMELALRSGSAALSRCPV